MPPRPQLPSDDLYARLGVPADASAEAIDIAWRGLLRKHHPDVAGPEGLDAAKRINVAHDWLSDPALRARYDAERAPGAGWSRRAARAGAPAEPGGGRATASPRPRRPATPGEQVAALVERIGRLDRDELDRLAYAEPAPIAFLATLRRFVPPALQAGMDAAEQAAIEALPTLARDVPGVRDAVVGRVVAVLVGDVLDELLGDPGAARVRERLTRGWDAAVGQPRYGPSTMAVTGLIERFAAMPAADLRWLAGTARTAHAAALAEAPWPPATSREEDEALRVSTELAAADARRSVRDAGGAPAAMEAAARVAHLLVLRHAFPASAFDRLAGPWLGTLLAPSGPPGARVRPRR